MAVLNGGADSWPTVLPADFQIKSFLISCAHCSVTIQTATRTLWSRGKWASIRCQQCNCSRSARKWLCICDLPWPGCEFHAPMGYECGKRSPKRKEVAQRSDSPPSRRTCLPALASTATVASVLKRKRTSASLDKPEGQTIANDRLDRQRPTVWAVPYGLGHHVVPPTMLNPGP